MTGIIYKATNIITNKCYIGQTVQKLNHRKRKHLNGTDNFYFHNSIRKYGEDNFIWEILCECSSKDELNEKEKYYIKFFNSKRPNGYNLNDGGNGNLGWTPSNETKRKISENHYDFSGKNNPNCGKYIITFPDGHIENIECLKIFCNDNNLNYSGMRRSVRNNTEYKGYRCNNVTK